MPEAGGQVHRGPPTWLARLRYTPLHPQWLMGRRAAPAWAASLAGSVLDIGAADRWLQPHLPDAAHYIALDYPPSGVRLYHARPDIHADGARLPLRDGVVDAVACLEVLEHVREPAAMLAEIHRVLRPGGRLFFSMPFLYPIHDAPHDYQRWTRYGLRRSLADAGFCIRRFQRTMPAVRVGAMLLALAVAGGAATAARGRWAWMAITAPLVLLVNLAGWLLGVLLPDWEAMAGGYEVEALRP